MIWMWKRMRMKNITKSWKCLWKCHLKSKHLTYFDVTFSNVIFLTWLNNIVEANASLWCTQSDFLFYINLQAYLLSLPPLLYILWNQKIFYTKWIVCAVIFVREKKKKERANSKWIWLLEENGYSKYYIKEKKNLVFVGSLPIL